MYISKLILWFPPTKQFLCAVIKTNHLQFSRFPSTYSRIQNKNNSVGFINTYNSLLAMLCVWVYAARRTYVRLDLIHFLHYSHVLTLIWWWWWFHHWPSICVRSWYVKNKRTLRADQIRADNLSVIFTNNCASFRLCVRWPHVKVIIKIIF